MGLVSRVDVSDFTEWRGYRLADGEDNGGVDEGHHNVLVELLLVVRPHLVIGSGFRVQGLGFGVWGLGFGVKGLGFRV